MRCMMHAAGMWRQQVVPWCAWKEGDGQLQINQTAEGTAV